MKNKNIFIIFLFQLFYNIFSFQGEFYYFSTDSTSIKELKINNNENVGNINNSYEGNLIPGSAITISLDKNKINNLKCVNIFGYIYYTDTNNNKISKLIRFKLENFGFGANEDYYLNGININ